MKLGDKGESVKHLQKILFSLGYEVAQDGDFGPKTESAVKLFQKENGLFSDGIVGPHTMDKLEGFEIRVKPVSTSEAIDTDGLDERSLKVIKSLDPKIQKSFTDFILKAKEIAKEFGVDYVAISGTRTEEQQNALYAQGRTKPGPKVTNARYPYSNHNHKIAVDMGCFKNGKYIDESSPAFSEKVHRAVSQIAAKYNLDWGGSWKSIKDYPHFEYKTGLSMNEKIERIKKYGTVFIGE